METLGVVCWSRFSFVSGVAVGFQIETASWAVGASLMACTNMHTSVLVIKAMLGSTGALGPL